MNKYKIIQDNTRDYKSTARYCQLKIQTPFCTRFFAHFNDFSSFQTHFTCLLLRSLASTRGGLLHFRTFLTTVAFPRQIFSSEKDKRQRHKRKTCLAAQELYCTLQHFLLHWEFFVPSTLSDSWTLSLHVSPHVLDIWWFESLHLATWIRSIYAIDVRTLQGFKAAAQWDCSCLPWTLGILLGVNSWWFL